MGDYNGTASGMISKYISDKDDMFGRVAKFNNSSYVALPNFPAINGSRTISAWFKTNDSSKSNQRIFADGEKNANGNYGISLGDSGEGRVRFYIKGVKNVNLDTEPIVENNKWYLVVARFDADLKQKTLQVYDENGSLEANVSQSIKGNVTAPKGAANIGSDFDGYIDKVLVFSSSLLDSEVETIVANQVAKKQYDGTAISKYKICPIADYRLDDLCGSGGDSFRVAQSANTGMDGTIYPISEALISKRAKVCTGAEFNGVNQYIRVDDADVLDNTQTLTTMAWIYPEELTQDNGTNARGLFSKRNSHSGDTQYAYGVFFWNGHKMDANKAALYVDVDSQNNRTYSTTWIKEKEWTHVAIVFDGRLSTDQRTKIYINGILDSTRKETSSFIPDYNSNFYIGNLYTLNNSQEEFKVFKGVMDEVKIFDQALNSDDIKKLYDHENAGKDYTGAIRNCTCSVGDTNVTFNAVDENGGCFNWDNNITTKIVSKDISLVILSKDENGLALPDANITKVELLNYSDPTCSNLSETYKIWEGNAQTGTDACFTLPLFVYPKASRCAKIRIFGEDKNTTAVDSFAIRPKKFDFTMPTDIYAGENFSFEFKALDDTSQRSQDYNETKGLSFDINATIAKGGCTNGVLNMANFSFKDGLQNVDANYSENGEINITVFEKLGSEFAFVDADDTNDTMRLIEPITKTFLIQPYELNITQADFNASNGLDWLYMAKLSDTNVTASASVQANNMQHEKLQNFDANCYASDVALKFFYSVVNPQDVNFTSTLDGSKFINDINKTIDINTSQFSQGVANIEYSFNIDRNHTTPLNPIDISLAEIKIDSLDVAKYENNNSINLSKKFYYGRITTKDITTNKTSINHDAKIEVYSNANLSGFKQNSINWYEMKDDSIANDFDFYPKKSFIFSSDEQNDSVQVTPLDTHVNAGVLRFTLEKQIPLDSDDAYIHLDIPKYLWYNRYSDYNATTDCGEHPCFRYIYNATGSSRNIQSGFFEGSSVAKDGNYTGQVQKSGVKTFR
ncbi:MAG: LamG domain-containing protein [Sulfurospirillum sp.]|nr:LamG domain-containing protein [Sulfurospirillum sp.]